MKTYLKLATAASLGVLAAITPAAAAIVCNEDGDCWKVKNKYKYKPEWKLRVYSDDWKWSDADRGKYRWRQREGRGYWRQGVWIEF
jgi:hypothetical protein